jgi:uncharacterized protein
MKIIPETILSEFYPIGSKTLELLLRHGELVAQKALDILDRAPWVNADRSFVYEAAMLHDIGIGRTKSPKLGCEGKLPYICHGIEGRKILDTLGLHRHGLVCERHVGVGIRKEEILRRELPLPERDMMPLSLEERLVCYADKFFSKSPKKHNEKSIKKIKKNLAKYDGDHVARFMVLHEAFTREPSKH